MKRISRYDTWEGYLWIVAILPWFVSGCVHNGTITASLYTSQCVLSYRYDKGEKVEFEFTIEYQNTNSSADPILLYLINDAANQGCPENACPEGNIPSLESSIDGQDYRIIRMREEDMWSGCKSKNNRLVCQGGRTSITSESTTYKILFARCGGGELSLSYSVKLQGYSGECRGSLSQSTNTLENSMPDSKSLAAITAIGCTNLGIVIFILSYVILRKWRLAKMRRQKLHSCTSIGNANNSQEIPSIPEHR